MIEVKLVLTEQERTMIRSELRAFLDWEVERMIRDGKQHGRVTGPTVTYARLRSLLSKLARKEE